MEMLTHKQIWAAIDALADKCAMSPSGLARKSGLDPTTFNPSKRFTSAGRERWPSTESIAKILKCTGTTVDTFMALIEEVGSKAKPSTNINYREGMKPVGIPLIGFAEAGIGGFFDDGGFPVGHGWDLIDSPSKKVSETAYALKVSGDSMLPLYREGDVLIVDPAVNTRKGDRVVVKTREGEVLAKVLERRSGSVIELLSVNPEYENLKFRPEEIEWIARIVWASQ